MANATEITPVVRRITCDKYGHARFLFTVTNIHDRNIHVRARIVGGPEIQSGWFEIDDGADRSLSPNATDQLIVDAHLPPEVTIGDYRIRLEVTETSKSGKSSDTSASVLLKVDQVLVPDPSLAPATPAPAVEPKKRRSLWGWLTGLFGFFGPLGARLGNWFWNGQPAGNRTVNVKIVKKALIVIAIVYGLSSVSAFTTTDAEASCTKETLDAIENVELREEKKNACVKSTILYKTFFLLWKPNENRNPDNGCEPNENRKPDKDCKPGGSKPASFKNVCGLLC